jgi:hypothetical protein
VNKNGHRFPHTISYRLTDEDFVRLQQKVRGTQLTVHDWCRDAALERLNRDGEMVGEHRIIFNQIARTQYLLGLGFHLLANNQLNNQEWKKLRDYAKENLETISNKVLEDDPANKRLRLSRKVES